jgi:hypothetical protein
MKILDKVRAVLAVAGVAGMILAISVAAAPPAVNAATCTDLGTHVLGMALTNASTSGTQSYIGRYDPRICAGNTQAGSAAWDGLEGPEANQIAQVGWTKYGAWSDSTVYYFYQYGTASGGESPPQMAGAVPSPTGGGSDKMTVYINGNGLFEFIINGNGVGNATLGWTPNASLWVDETHFWQDQTPGDTNFYVYYTTTQHLYNGTWDDTNPSNWKFNSDELSGTGVAGYGSSYFYTYDQRYSSQG